MNDSLSKNANSKYIAAAGSALVDMCLIESDDFLQVTGASKGGMTLVDGHTIKQILSNTTKSPVIVPGGSACNTILGIGKLGGQARFIGKLGNDELGSKFLQGLINHNVEPVILNSDSPTGHVLSIITPDAQRSMFTYLGASSETQPEEITSDMFSNCALVHIEGYLLFNKDLMTATLKAAKENNALVSLDLASFTVVESARDFIEEICTEYVDILIANEDEARAFTGCDDEQKALDKLSQKAQIAVLKVGKRGSFIAHKNDRIKIDPIGNGNAVDTTGAGDLWAAGFLYGLFKGFSLEKCGKLGSSCGYEVCQVIGATIPDEGWDRIKQII
jgi:sugar/nucleoside kinase (ribokinase family)